MPPAATTEPTTSPRGTRSRAAVGSVQLRRACGPPCGCAMVFKVTGSSGHRSGARQAQTRSTRPTRPPRAPPPDERGPSVRERRDDARGTGPPVRGLARERGRRGECHRHVAGREGAVILALREPLPKSEVARVGVGHRVGARAAHRRLEHGSYPGGEHGGRPEAQLGKHAQGRVGRVDSHCIVEQPATSLRILAHPHSRSTLSCPRDSQRSLLSSPFPPASFGRGPTGSEYGTGSRRDALRRPTGRGRHKRSRLRAPPFEVDRGRPVRHRPGPRHARDVPGFSRC